MLHLPRINLEYFLNLHVGVELHGTESNGPLCPILFILKHCGYIMAGLARYRVVVKRDDTICQMNCKSLIFASE